jgi:flagellum-specific peptidoglycan hydrolase FlgJ
MKTSYDFTNVLGLKNYPDAKPLPKPHLTTGELKRIVFVSNFGWLLTLLGTLAFLYLLFLVTIQLRGMNLNANDRVQQLEAQVAHLSQLHQEVVVNTLGLAGKMQRILDSAEDNQRDFIASLLPEALATQASQGIPASAIIAMAIHESGYGRSDLARNDHNLFGIKAFSTTWDGPTARHRTIDSGRSNVASFRKFEDLSSGVHGYADFLTSSWRYQKALQYHNGEKFVQAILAGGYCPDPTYLNNIRTIMARHHLQLLDLPEPMVQETRLSTTTPEEAIFGVTQELTALK